MVMGIYTVKWKKCVVSMERSTLFLHSRLMARMDLTDGAILRTGKVDCSQREFSNFSIRKPECSRFMRFGMREVSFAIMMALPVNY